MDYSNNNNMYMNNANMPLDANTNKYMEYKKMCDYHWGKCNYYKAKSMKVKYGKHYKYYKYYYAKMVYYGKKCGYHEDSYEKECETHTHYKHYYHHHHIEKHHHHCDDSCSSS